MFKIQLSHGQVLEVSQDHCFNRYEPDGDCFQWVNVEGLHPGDCILEDNGGCGYNIYKVVSIL